VLTIDCIFDKELGPDGLDPLGSLVISDGNSEFRIDDTYLDSWLVALIEGLHSLPALKQIGIVAPEEKKRIEVKIAGGGKIALSYGGTTVVAGGRGEFDRAVRLAAAKFLIGVDSVAAEPRNTDIAFVRRFAGSTQN
jgi:hypothetical protein